MANIIDDAKDWLEVFKAFQVIGDKSLACRCGCGVGTLTSHFHPAIFLLYIYLKARIEADFGKPMVITSGFRCPRHNWKIGGVQFSYHTFGNALDIACPDGITPIQFGRYLDDLISKYASNSKGQGIEDFGIGTYIDKRMCHIDTGAYSPKGRRWRE